jgi:hypothetical protein
VLRTFRSSTGVGTYLPTKASAEGGRDEEEPPASRPLPALMVCGDRGGTPVYMPKALMDDGRVTFDLRGAPVSAAILASVIRRSLLIIFYLSKVAYHWRVYFLSYQLSFSAYR